MPGTKISALPAAGALAGTEPVPIVQAGATKQTTTGAIAGLTVSPAGANPTATAGPAAVNGVATAFMRSDAAPAVQKASNTQFGIVEVDGTTIIAAAGVISAVQPAGANPTATAGPAAVNGVAATFMRSDAAPAVQLGSAAQAGLLQVDNVTLKATAGVAALIGNPLLITSLKFGGGTTLGSYIETTWVPSDDSGAGLVITNIACARTNIGRMRFIQVNLTYPATVDGSGAAITGFGPAPFGFLGTGVFFTTSVGFIFGFVGSGSGDIIFFTAAGVQLTNANLSGQTIQGTLSYA